MQDFLFGSVQCLGCNFILAGKSGGVMLVEWVVVCWGCCSFLLMQNSSLYSVATFRLGL